MDGGLHQAMRTELRGLDEDLARGKAGAATGWLKEKVQRHGGLYEPHEVIRQATGGAPSEEPLLQYLETKFGALYDL